MKLLDKTIQGRESFQRRAWADAYQCLMLADRESPLVVEDLERLATAAYLTGRDPDFYKALDRAHRAHIEAGDPACAARCSFWSGLNYLFQGEAAQANGWFARAQRLVENRDCVERGYLLLPVAERYLREHDNQAACDMAASAAETGERFGDADLIAAARHLQGRAQIQAMQVQGGLSLLDEVMLSVVAGELSPIMTGLMYCAVIEACHQVYALSRAREWTTALTHWCEQQSQMVAFTSVCLVHRAEIMQLGGAWPDAMAEIGRARERSIRPSALAFYQQGELYRLRGDHAAAEEAYRNANVLGWEPQPGLALLWLSQCRTDAACAAIHRVIDATTDRLQRARLLPAYIEIMLAVDNIDDADNACSELERIAELFHSNVLRAAAAQARGAVELAAGNARSALRPLRRAFELWREIEAPYEAGRVRALIGQACRALGDNETGELELDAARAIFERLGAAPELARLLALDKDIIAPGQHVLTPRELQVLRLIAAGRTNKAIAAELFLSERTIDRHVSNIFGKLNVPSRAAATARAYEHNLL